MGIEQKLNADQKAAMLRSFAQAVAAGDQNAMARDRFGVTIKAGDLLLYRPNVDMVFKVADVKPVLDPRIGPGHVTIVLVVEAPITLRVGMPVSNMIVIGMPATAPAEAPPLDPPMNLHGVPEAVGTADPLTTRPGGYMGVERSEEPAPTSLHIVPPVGETTNGD